MQLLDSDAEIYRSLYRDLDLPLPSNYLEKSAIKTPKLPSSIHFAKERQVGYNYVDKKETTKERLIRSMQTITGIDQLIGNLRQTLQEQGIADNTIIVFTSDHGLFFGEFGLGGKALCYETTTHVPMIIHNPMVTESAKGIVSNELVQTIDIAPTLLKYAGIELPTSFQGKLLNALIEGKQHTIRDYLFTENLWSTQFGNPRCESVQDKDWKYIRYYKNENLKATIKIEAAQLLGIKKSKMLYAVHDPDIALYRHFVEAPLKGEQPVYEELYHLKSDPQETANLVGKKRYKKLLRKFRIVWREKIKYARGQDKPQVVRYIKD